MTRNVCIGLIAALLVAAGDARAQGKLKVVATTEDLAAIAQEDGKILYVSDSDRHAVAAFDLDGRGGASNQRDVITNIHGVPGGLRVDANGRIYVAAHGLGVYSREGKLVHTLFESDVITNCAFGDTDFETLYVTSRDKLFRLRLGVKGAVQY